jgi:integrase/recombinase XerC
MEALTVASGGLVPVIPGGAVVASTRDWLAGIEKRTTRRSYRAGLRDFAAWLGRAVVGEPFTLDDLPVNSGEMLSARAVKRYVADLEKQGKARATVNHRLSTVRKWTRALEDAELIHPHRAEAVYHIKGLAGKNRSHRSYLSESEVQTVLDTIGSENLIDVRDRALFALLAWNGLRRSEVCSLRLGQYKAASGHHIIDGIQRKGHDLDWVKVAVPVQRALEAWWQAAGLVDPEDPFFCAVNKAGRATGQPLSTNGVYLMVKRRTEAAGFEDITPHALRRSMATNMDLAGAPTSLIQSAGGWRSRAMLDLYIQQSASLDHNGTDYLHLAV